ncbi:regulatory protein RecX [Halothiobacillus sp. DCM-1]|uniref:regulatory protein RecX n=1 Tax=Halothiobacillus sp. DCM-1 TaxID=3112558 RepID=UPI00324CBB37
MLRRPRSRAPDEDQLRPTALRLLAQREHSQQELRAKLSQRGFARAAIDQTIEALCEAGWQSDARYAASYLRARLARGYGLLAITAELRARGVQPNDIHTALTEESPDWHSCAAEQLRRHFGQPLTAELRKKAYRHLIQRGFRHEEAIAALDSLTEDD